MIRVLSGQYHDAKQKQVYRRLLCSKSTGLAHWCGFFLVTLLWSELCVAVLAFDCAPNSVLPPGGTQPEDCQCNAGYSGADYLSPVAVCSPCPVGTYKSFNGTGNCSTCPLGRDTYALGSTSVDACVCKGGSSGALDCTCKIRRIFYNSSSDFPLVQQWYKEVQEEYYNRPVYTGEISNHYSIYYSGDCDGDADKKNKWVLGLTKDKHICSSDARDNSGSHAAEPPLTSGVWVERSRIDVKVDFLFQNFFRGLLPPWIPDPPPDPTCVRSCPCTSCETGKYRTFLDPPLECGKCPVGTFQNTTSSTRCNACVTDADSNSDRNECACNVGYSGNGVISCEACPAGTFRDSQFVYTSFVVSTPWFMGPSSWPAIRGEVTADENLLACKTPGQNMKGKIALIKIGENCIVGFISQEAQDIGALAVIFISENPLSWQSSYRFNIPIVTMSRRYVNKLLDSKTRFIILEKDMITIQASDTCDSCQAGTFSTVTAATSRSTCIACAAGTFSTVTAATSRSTCIACPAGKFSMWLQSAIDTCTSCQTGKFSEAIASSTCMQCPLGKFSETIAGTSETTCSILLSNEKAVVIELIVQNITAYVKYPIGLVNTHSISNVGSMEFAIQVDIQNTNDTLDSVVNTIQNGIANMTKIDHKYINVTVSTQEQRRLLQITEYTTFSVVITMPEIQTQDEKMQINLPLLICIPLLLLFLIYVGYRYYMSTTGISKQTEHDKSLVYIANTNISCPHCVYLHNMTLYHTMGSQLFEVDSRYCYS